MIDALIIFNFFVFVVCCVLIARRYGRQLRHEMHDERARYKRLVEYRAGLRKQVTLSRHAIEKQSILCDDLALKIALWKERYDAQQAEKEQAYARLDERAQQKYNQQIEVYALQKMQARVMHEALQQVRHELEHTLRSPAAGEQYNEESLRLLKQAKRLP